MIAAAIALIGGLAFGGGEYAPPAPASIVVATTRGQAVVPVSVERGHPVLPVPQLSGLLPLTARLDGEWAVVEFAELPFRFLLNAPVYAYGGNTFPLVGGAYTARDTLFVPFDRINMELIIRLFCFYF